MPPKHRKSASPIIINILLTVVCGILIFLGIRIIPGKIKDVRLPYPPEFVDTYDEEDQQFIDDLMDGKIEIETAPEDRERIPSHGLPDWYYRGD